MTDIDESNRHVPEREIEHFVHAPGMQPAVAKRAASERLRDVLASLHHLQGHDEPIYMFVGECDEALREADEVDDGADAHEPVDIELTLAVLEIERHRHIHAHHCRHIAVTVHYGGKSKRHRFSPNSTVGVATDWARAKYHLDPAISAEFVLQIVGSVVQPRSDQHLGDVVPTNVCSIEFDLVKELTPRG